MSTEALSLTSTSSWKNTVKDVLSVAVVTIVTNAILFGIPTLVDLWDKDIHDWSFKAFNELDKYPELIYSIIGIDATALVCILGYALAKTKALKTTITIVALIAIVALLGVYEEHTHEFFVTSTQALADMLKEVPTLVLTAFAVDTIAAIFFVGLYIYKLVKMVKSHRSEA